MGFEVGTFWDEHWVLYGNQSDNKLHILKKKKVFFLCLEEMLTGSSYPHLTDLVLLTKDTFTR